MRSNACSRARATARPMVGPSAPSAIASAATVSVATASAAVKARPSRWARALLLADRRWHDVASHYHNGGYPPGGVEPRSLSTSKSRRRGYCIGLQFAASAPGRNWHKAVIADLVDDVRCWGKRRHWRSITSDLRFRDLKIQSPGTDLPTPAAESLESVPRIVWPADPH